MVEAVDVSASKLTSREICRNLVCDNILFKKFEINYHKSSHLSANPIESC